MQKQRFYWSDLKQLSMVYFNNQHLNLQWAHTIYAYNHCLPNASTHALLSETFMQVSAIRMDTFETVTREVVISITNTEGNILCSSLLQQLISEPSRKDRISLTIQTQVISDSCNLLI